jgi:hypothetical protein
MKTFGKAPERREFARKTICLQGRIVLPCRRAIACTVEDVSVGGAMIVPNEKVWLPQIFKLTVVAGNFETYCEVRHRIQYNVGVAFVAAPKVEEEVEWEAHPALRALGANDALRARLGVNRQQNGSGHRPPDASQAGRRPSLRR